MKIILREFLNSLIYVKYYLEIEYFERLVNALSKIKLLTIKATITPSFEEPSICKVRCLVSYDENGIFTNLNFKYFNRWKRCDTDINISNPYLKNQFKTKICQKNQNHTIKNILNGNCCIIVEDITYDLFCNDVEGIIYYAFENERKKSLKLILLTKILKSKVIK